MVPTCQNDLETLGWRCRQLDQCVFLNYDGDELVGLIGVYVDDFIIAGKQNGKHGKLKKNKSKRFINVGNGNLVRLRYVVSEIYKTRLLSEDGPTRIHQQIENRGIQSTNKFAQAKWQKQIGFKWINNVKRNQWVSTMAIDKLPDGPISKSILVSQRNGKSNTTHLTQSK